MLEPLVALLFVLHPTNSQVEVDKLAPGLLLIEAVDEEALTEFETTSVVPEILACVETSIAWPVNIYASTLTSPNKSCCAVLDGPKKTSK